MATLADAARSAFDELAAHAGDTAFEQAYARGDYRGAFDAAAQAARGIGAALKNVRMQISGTIQITGYTGYRSNFADPLYCDLRAAWKARGDPAALDDAMTTAVEAGSGVDGVTWPESDVDLALLIPAPKPPTPTGPSKPAPPTTPPEQPGPDEPVQKPTIRARIRGALRRVFRR